MPFVYSKLACDNCYPVKVDKDQVKKAIKEGKLIPKTPGVTIKGGAGVMQKNLQTPHGVVTEVSDSELELLKKNTSFQKHMKNGYLKIEDKMRDMDKVISDMEGRDGGDQLVDEDFEEDEKPKTTKKPKKNSGKKAAKKRTS